MLQRLIFVAKHFGDNNSLFSFVNWTKASASALNKDSLKMQGWTYQWQMSFDPDRAKQTQRVYKTNKSKKS